jgi:hypothetical protein
LVSFPFALGCSWEKQVIKEPSRHVWAFDDGYVVFTQRNSKVPGWNAYTLLKANVEKDTDQNTKHKAVK